MEETTEMDNPHSLFQRSFTIIATKMTTQKFQVGSFTFMIFAMNIKMIF